MAFKTWCGRPHVHMPTGAPETSLLVAFEEIQFSKVGTPYCTRFLVSTKHRLARCRLCSKLSRLDRPDIALGLKPNPLEPVARRGRHRAVLPIQARERVEAS